jgi:hypothetical protein
VHDQQRETDDQQGLRHAGQSMPPDRRRNEGDVAKDRNRSDRAAILAQRRREDVHSLPSGVEVLPAAPPRPYSGDDSRRRGLDTRCHAGCDGESRSGVVVDSHSREVLVVPILVYQCLQLSVRTGLEDPLDGASLAFG